MSQESQIRASLGVPTVSSTRDITESRLTRNSIPVKFAGVIRGDQLFPSLF